MIRVFFIYLVNFLLGSLIIWFEISSASDKSTAVSFFLYSGLLFLNIVVGFLAKFDKAQEYRHYFLAALYLVLGVCLIDLLPEFQELFFYLFH